MKNKRTDEFKDLCSKRARIQWENNMERRLKAAEGAKKQWSDSEFRKNISKKMTGSSNHFYGKYHSAETKKKMSESKRGTKNYLFGKKLTEEQKQKMGIYKLKSKEHRKRLSDSHKGLLSGSKNGMFGKTHSEETKRKLKEYMLNGGAAHSNSFIQNPSKPQVELYWLCKTICEDSILNYPEYRTNHSIDIALPNHNIAIEYDGSYWHQDMRSDIERQKQLEDLGWKFIRYRDRIPSLEELENEIMKVHADGK